METDKLINALRVCADDDIIYPACELYDKECDGSFDGTAFLMREAAKMLEAQQKRIAELERTIGRLGEFGRLFLDYQGCPRGPKGRAGGISVEDEAFLMPELVDVDGGKWIPVNVDVLREMKSKLVEIKQGNRWIPVTERLPKLIPCGAGTAYSEAINVLTSGHKVLTAIWNGTDFIADAEFWEAEDEEITHWTPVLLPLPYPPKEEAQ